MNLSPLHAISPLDGRYSAQSSPLSPYFSEFGLIHYRVRIEVEYLIFLSGLGLKNCPSLPDEAIESLRSWIENFSSEDAEQVKMSERIINHDVKAVEYLVKQKLEEGGWGKWKEFVHFGLTSQDINNTAIPLSMKEGYLAIIRPGLVELLNWLERAGWEWREVPMLARTHGQPASPTRFGKEFMVFAERIRRQLELLDQVPFMAKFGGATGGFNAHYVAYPEVNWVDFGDRFVEALGMKRAKFTTQIEHYDCFAAFCDGLARINTILIDFCRDVWQYISLEYLRQKVKDGEVGSSAMPHKVNPIDFENAEGNLGFANAILHHFSAKLPVSRLQRDLTDSTVLRNVGVPLGHSLVAYRSIRKGLDKIVLDEDAILRDLNAHPEVVTEAIQTILRREGYPQPYEALKNLSRVGRKMDMADIRQFISSLEVSDELKSELLQIRPETYIGIFPE